MINFESSKHLFASLMHISTLVLFIHATCAAQITRPIGINLAGIEDWSEEFVFVDIMNQSREWIFHDLGPNADWSSDLEIPLRSDGYPVEVPYVTSGNTPQGARALLYFGELENLYPGGDYHLKIDGSGQVELWGAATGIFECPVDTSIAVDNSLGGIAIELLESRSDDPVHNIRMIMPGFENTYEVDQYHPALLEFLDDFQVIRFMDWMKTNNSEVSTWSDRTLTEYYTQTARNGVAYEHLIDLCNLLKKDAWINIPHRADDNYVTELAIFVRDRLETGLKVHIEYSNEVWNSIFSQNQYASEQGDLLGYPGQTWEQSWIYTAKRSADVFQIFEDQFADDSRFIKVLPGFSASPYITEFIIDRFNEPQYNPTQINADAVAIAPYFGGALADDISTLNLQDAITVEQLIDSLELRLPEALSYMSATKVIADEHSLELVAYEGGQHVVANYPNNENSEFVEKLLEVNRHPKMQEFYCEYLDYWYDTVEGGLFAHFSSHGGYNQFGSWGIKESYEDVDSPKYLALKNCVFDKNSTSNFNAEQHNFSNIKLYPNPVKNNCSLRGDLSDSLISLYDCTGNIITEYASMTSPIHIDMSHLKPGMYLLQVKNRISKIDQVLKLIKI